MLNIAMMNAKKINFDGLIDFNPIRSLGSVTFYDESSPSEVLLRSKDQDCIVTKGIPLGRDELVQMPERLKFICEASTGYDNIDLDAAAYKGIRVMNVPSYASESVCQLIVSFMLSLSIGAFQHRSSNFQSISEPCHDVLTGKTAGIVGATGHIAKCLIPVLKSLGMEILGTTRINQSGKDAFVQFTDLDSLLRASDFVILLCPLNALSYHLIGWKQLVRMKKTAYLINTARGPIVDEAALIFALRERQIAGAALDVLEVEPPDSDNPLLRMSNVIVTAHIGWQALQARQLLVTQIAENIRSIRDNREINIVNSRHLRSFELSA